MKFLITQIAAVVFCTLGLKSGAASADSTIYDSNPDHLWNRLNQTLFDRTAPDGKNFGLDELDILYWFHTTNLVTEPSHQPAIAILDEFINSHGEKLVRDPLKRALLQRDLWELFDWSAKNHWNMDEARARRELQSRLAIAIRRLALTTNEIAALPDNYALTKTNDSPDLPKGLLQTNSDWVLVSDLDDQMTAPAHVSSFDGHSTFQVLFHVPAGRQAALDYLEQLRSFAQQEHVWVYQTNNFAWESTNAPREVLALNPALPQFPTNTEWALVRRMCLIDTEGHIRPTAFTESVQMRRYYALTRSKMLMVTNSNGNAVLASIPPQNNYEFQMSRRQNNQLREIGQNERGFNFVHFMGQGVDQFEYQYRKVTGEPLMDSAKLQSVTLHACTSCHSQLGIFSVNSYTRELSFSESSQQRPATLAPTDSNRQINEINNAISWKQRQYDWGLLQGLWYGQEN